MDESEQKEKSWFYKAAIPITVALITAVGVILAAVIHLYSPKESSNVQAIQSPPKDVVYVIEVMQFSPTGAKYVENAEVIFSIGGERYQPGYTDKTGQARFTIPPDANGKQGTIVITYKGNTNTQYIVVRPNEVTKIMLD